FRQSRDATRPECPSTSTPRSSRGRLPGSASACGPGSPRAIPPGGGIRWSMSREAGFPVARSRLLIPARTGASPSAFAICGLPPAGRFNGLASFAPGLAFAPGFAGPLAFVPAFAVFVALAAGLRAPLARDARLAIGFPMPSVIIRPFLLNVSRVRIRRVATRAGVLRQRLVFVVAAPPDARLVAPLGSAVEPLVHAPEGVQSARIRGVGVVDDVVVEHERAHAGPLARIRGCVGSGHGRERSGSVG